MFIGLGDILFEVSYFAIILLSSKYEWVLERFSTQHRILEISSMVPLTECPLLMKRVEHVTPKHGEIRCTALYQTSIYHLE